MSNRTLVIWFLLVAGVFGAITLYAVFQGDPRERKTAADGRLIHVTFTDAD